MDDYYCWPSGVNLGYVIASFDSVAFLQLATILFFLICSSVVAIAEVSFFSLTPTDLEQLKQVEGNASRKLLQLLDKPKSLIATIVMSHNLVNIVVVIISELFFHNYLKFDDNPLLGFIIQVIAVTFFILLIGEVMPKIFASSNPKKYALMLAYPFAVVQQLLNPFVIVLVKIAGAFDKRIKQRAPEISVDQLSQALELTSGMNTPPEERKILKGIVEFGSIEVSQIMKPRIDVVAFEANIKFTEIVNLILKNGFSRVPIYNETLDAIAGVLFIKDLIAHIDKDDSFAWQDLLRPAFFVPESKKIDDLMKDFQARKIHLAVVVDEYGGTCGIVTLEDVIEEVIGEINDEFDVEELIYSRLDANNYIFEAKIPLNDLYRILDIDGEIFEHKKGESDSLGGFILELCGKIPNKNELVIFDKYAFTIESVDKRRIKRIKLTIRGDE